MGRRWPKENSALVDTIDRLKAHTRETGAALWRDIALRLERPRSQWAVPNVSRLNRHTEAGSGTIVVPGSLLGTGQINGPREVAAWRVSDKARKKIEAEGGEVLTIDELMRRHPKGVGVMILG